MQYELLYLVPATKTETEVQEVKKEITTLLQKHTTAILRDELIPKMKLAYAINGVRYGYYVLVVLEAQAEKIYGMDEELRHNRDILRHLLTVAEHGADKVELRLAEYEVPDPEVRKKAPEKKMTVKLPVMANDVPVVSIMTDEQLDKKLNQILESDIDKL